MVNGAFNLSSTPRDLALQRRDPRLQLGDRQAVEILGHQRRQRVPRTGAEDIVEIHGRER